MPFEWDERKNLGNIRKHAVSFQEAKAAFLDPNRIITFDAAHSAEGEKRYFCFGKPLDKVLTVRFTIRGENIRIFGAGYWREGRKRYEKENSL
jgi:hypothetical protein